MKSSQQIVSLIVFSLIISSLADRKTVSPFHSPSYKQHNAIPPRASARSASAPSPSDTPSRSTFRGRVASVDEWCKKTDYPTECHASISPSVKRPKVTLYTAVDLMIKYAANATKDGITQFHDLAKKQILSKDDHSALTNYEKLFEESVDRFREAQFSIRKKDWDMADTLLSQALTNFVEGTEQKPTSTTATLVDISKKLTKITSNCVALNALLDPQEN